VLLVRNGNSIKNKYLRTNDLRCHLIPQNTTGSLMDSSIDDSILVEFLSVRNFQSYSYFKVGLIDWTRDNISMVVEFRDTSLLEPNDSVPFSFTMFEQNGTLYFLYRNESVVMTRPFLDNDEWVESVEHGVPVFINFDTSGVYGRPFLLTVQIRLKSSYRLNRITIEEQGTWSHDVPVESSLCSDYLKIKKMNLQISGLSLASCSFNVFISILNAIGIILLCRNYLIKKRLITIVPCCLAFLLFDVCQLIFYPILIYYYQRMIYLTDKIPLTPAIGAIRAWLILVAMTCYVAYSIRYFHMRNFYRIMSLSTTDVSRKQLAVHRKIASSSTYVIFVTIMALIIALLVGIFAGFFPFSTLAVNVIAIVAAALGALCGFVALVVDFALNWSKTRKDGILNYFSMDPLRIRLEMFFIIPATIVGVTYGILLLTSPKSRSYARLSAHIAFQEIFYALLGISVRLVLSGGLVCILVFLKSLKPSPFSDTVSDEGVNNLLRDADVYKMMYRYCKQEFSLENILLWTHLNNLSKSIQISTEDLQDLFESYVKPKAIYEVNLPAKTIKEFKALVERAGEDGVRFEEVNVLLAGQLTQNLSDTFTRFSDSEAFKTWKESKTASERFKL